MRKDISFKTTDGTTLRGWHYLPGSSGGGAIERDDGARNYGILRVRNHAMQRTGGLCVDYRDCGQQTHSRE